MENLNFYNVTLPALFQTAAGDDDALDSVGEGAVEDGREVLGMLRLAVVLALVHRVRQVGTNISID